MAAARPLRLGIMGVGRMGQVHLDNMMRRQALGECVVAGKGDRHEPTMAQAMASPAMAHDSKPRVSPTFSSPEEMVNANLQLDGVIIASRTEDHMRDALPFAKAGVPVLMEKPFANTSDEAFNFLDALSELPDAGRKLVMVGHSRAYDPAANAAGAWLQAGLIGAIQQSHHVHQQKNPRTRKSTAPGIVSDMMSQLVFEAMYFHSWQLPARLFAMHHMAPHYDDAAGEGANVVHGFLSWEDGSIAHLHGSRVNVCGYDNSFTLTGTEGRIDVGQFVGDFGDVSAKLFRGNGKLLAVDPQVERGTLCEELHFPMTEGRVTPGRLDDDPVNTDGYDHPDYYSRYATAFDNELGAFMEHVRSDSPFVMGPDVGWKTLFVANLLQQNADCLASGFWDISHLRNADDAKEYHFNTHFRTAGSFGSSFGAGI